MIVTKRKACQNAGVFQHITDDETDDEKGEDAAPLVTHCPMKQGKGQRHHNENRYENRDGNVVRKDRIHQCQHDIENNQRPKKRGDAFFHLTSHFLIQTPLAGRLGSWFSTRQ